MINITRCLKNILTTRNFAKKAKEVVTLQGEMKYLNVAEKHDAAKTIAGLLSNGTASRREGYSKYNKIFDFEATVRGAKCKMVMTSVSGHLLTFEFLNSYRNWRNVDPSSLFDAPVRKSCSEDYQPIKRTLEREVRNCGGLIIWTDCDREGENIGYEIIDVCRAIKPNITVYRAIFSEITTTSIRRALQQLRQPDKRQSDAVDIRSELDLRTGAAITRFQTMRFQRLFPEKIANKLISYGSCQIPTLGFVAERYKEIEAFVSEPFWKIRVTHTIDELTVEFNWARNRLFDKNACEDYYLLCLADPKAKVESVAVKPKNKWRPTPLDTVELEKLGSRKLKLSAKETMTIAEKLYTKGFISYPRTETNQFSKEFDLRSIVEQQTGHNNWGSFAARVMEWGPNPRNGNKSDQAHPPIHPTKLATNLDGNEARIYELVCRHFLACVSKDATGSETIVKIDIAGEKFTATGLCIHERNYLDVYIYDKWNAKQIHNYTEGQIFDPTEISMPEGATTPPALLTEADLISLMEKHGIGTDATHAEHINTIKERGYIGVVDKGFLVPGVIGMGLYEGYDAMQLALAKPLLRAEFEADLKKICLGEKEPNNVLQTQIVKYKQAYKEIMERITAMDEKMSQRINETPTANQTNDSHTTNGTDQGGSFENNTNRLQEIFKCPKCNIAPMALKAKKNKNGFYVGCLNYPDCKNVIWLPSECHEPIVRDEFCPNCGEGYKMLKFKFSTASYRALFNAPTGWYKACLCCDTQFRETFDINLDSVKRTGAIVGVGGGNEPPIRENSRRPDNVLSAGNTNTLPNNQSAPGNKKNPNGDSAKTTQTKRVTKKSIKEKQSTNIRSYFTDASRTNNVEQNRGAISSTAVASSAINNEINELFNSNDSFDMLLLSVDNETIVSNNNANSNLNSVPGINDDISAAFQNDDEDWIVDLGVSSAIKTIATQSQRNTLSNEIENSFSNVFEADIDYDSISWGSGNSNKRTVQEPKTKRPRIQEIPPTVTRASTVLDQTISMTERGDSPKERTSESYAWGSATRQNVQAISGHEVKCTGCHQVAKELNVKKDGPNKGRIFYACPKEKQCKFFQWSDEQPDSTTALNVRSSSPPTTSKSVRTKNVDLTASSSRDTYSWGSGSQNNNLRTENVDFAASSPTDTYSWGSGSQNNNVRTENVDLPASSFGDTNRWGNGSQNIEKREWGTSSVRGKIPPKPTSNIATTTATSGNSSDIKCKCGTPATSLTVRKDGPNKGRAFHGCAQRSCNFFQWGDENDNQVQNNRETKKRKCGLCRQEGHTKLKCPRKDELGMFT